MPVPFEGGCACGAIRYSCAGKPHYMGNCHCRDCQRATGTAYFPAIVVKTSDFSIITGSHLGSKNPRIAATSCDGHFAQTAVHRCS